MAGITSLFSELQGVSNMASSVLSNRSERKLFLQCGGHGKPLRLRMRSTVRCKADADLEAATHAAALRFQESQRPDPLFHDPYAGCFLGSDLLSLQCSSTSSLNLYCLATRFIDDKLLGVVNMHNGVRQIVLLTDGMDTRPYRLKWPPKSMLFDISPGCVFQIASKKLEGVGAKTARNSIFHHIPAESSDMQEMLRGMGYRGDRPSIWAIQGLYSLTLARLQEILSHISSLAMKDSFLVGEIPLTSIKADAGAEDNVRKWMEKTFKGNGFLVHMITYEDVARDLGRNLLADDGEECEGVLFVAQQQRLSDDQVELIKREMDLAEESGDEEGFEDL